MLETPSVEVNSNGDSRNECELTAPGFVIWGFTILFGQLAVSSVIE